MKTILVATDFSTTSWNAVKYAAQMSMECATSLKLVHAAHLPVVHDFQPDVSGYLDHLVEEDQARIERMVTDLKRLYGKELIVSAEVKMGFAGEILRDQARSSAISLVIMGIHHADAFSRFLFGSTTTSVAGELQVPVLVIPEESEFQPWTKVGFAFDQHEMDWNNGLFILQELLGIYEGEIHFAHVDDDLYPDDDDSSALKVAKKLGRVQSRIHHLPPGSRNRLDVLLDWSQENKMRVLVMLARKHSLLRRLFNECNTQQMAFKTTVPLLIISDTSQN